MARLAGDPGVLRWLRFAAGFRLPPENRDWVRHELTDAGWRLRTVLRHLAVIVPICAVLVVVFTVVLPSPLWLSLAMVALILCGSVFTVAAYADDLRASRLRQHGLEVPDDPDLGHPAH
jgi:membrane protein YdbS with pleckstrin-like domain